MRFDAIIVGGGPAGLSAALLLGRCRRSVALIDDGRPRNAASPHAHGFFTREGTPPLELLRIGREQLAPFDVMIFKATALDVRGKKDGFAVTLSTRKVVTGRKLLLATGLKDELPPVEASRRCTGRACSTVRTATAGRCGICRWRLMARAPRARSLRWAFGSGAGT